MHVSSYYHIMTQGINRLNIFETGKEKYIYLKYLNEDKYNIKVLAYVIMDNHMHMLIYNENGNDISHWMRLANTKYAKFYNKQHDRVGYVYRDRYKSKPILDRDYLYNVLAYIHFNPIEAGIVKKLNQYSFSSYNDFLYHRKEKEEIILLFENEDYKSIFDSIHERYNQKLLLKSSEKSERILEKYLQGKKIGEVRRDKELIAKIVMDIKKENKLNDCQIIKLLGIGKNRIKQLKDEGFIKVEITDKYPNEEC